MSRWPKVRIKDIASFLKGKKPVVIYDSPVSGAQPYILIENFNGKYRLFTDDKRCVPCFPDDTLIVADGANCGLTSSGHKGFLGSTIGALRPDANQIHPRFLFFYVHGLFDILNTRVRGSAVPHLERDLMLDLEIALPPISEQGRLVRLLDEAEQLRRLRSEADRYLADCIPALFHEMFGDPAINRKGWPVRHLGELTADGPQNGLYKHSSFYGDGIPILRIDAFYDGEVKDYTTLKRLRLTQEELHRYQLRNNDIVVNRVNSPEYLGKSAIITSLQEPTVFESNMMRFSVFMDQIEPTYLIHLLQTPHAKQHFLSRAKHAINQSSINQDDVKSLLIPVPSLTLQREFASRISDIRSIEISQIAGRQKLDDLFQSLLHGVFQGDL